MAPKTSTPEGEANERFLEETEAAKECSPLEPMQGAGAAEVDFDAILPHAGEFGRYQWFLFLAMFPFAIFFAFVYFVQIFVTVAPQQHWCRVPELDHLPLLERKNLSIPYDATGGFDRCRQYHANWSQVLESGSGRDPSWPTVPCQRGWEFDMREIPYATITTELGWVCERRSYPTIAQALFFCGSVVGGLLFGWIADRFGRIPALVGCNMIGCIGGIASMFATNLWDFSFYRFLVGLAYDNCFMMIYIIVLEYVGARYRTRAANMSIALFFGLGCVTLPWIALWVADWRRLLLYTSLPMLLVCAVPWLIPESARWLLTQGRVNEAVAIIHRIEKVNRTKVPEKLLQDFKATSKLQSTTPDEGNIKQLLKRPPLRWMTLYLVLVYMACAIVFDALVRLSEALGLDMFLTFTLTSATETPSVTLLARLLDRWGRRWLSCGPMVISGAACLIAAFVPSGIPSVSLAVISRFFINMSYNTAIQWAAELFPTNARAGGTSLVHIMGYVATGLSPFIVYLEQLVPSLPLILLGVVAVGGGTLSLLLPETMNRDLPQSFEDAEEMMSQRRAPTRKPKDIEMKEWQDIQSSGQDKPLSQNAA